MARLLISVEGETEETFVNEVLAPYLYNFGYSRVAAKLLGNARQRDRRGGIRTWSSIRGEILEHLAASSDCLVTTMVDYYGLPATGADAWPGRETANSISFQGKAKHVQDALLNNIKAGLGDSLIINRFIPYVVMHEFEGLLFSDCQRFGAGIGHPELIPELQAIRNAFNTPEEINDSQTTAPSKRIKLLLPEYEKPLFGTLAVLEIGLDVIRAQCSNFSDWLAQLEQWPSR